MVSSPIPILYEDPHCFVIDKPSGIATITEGESDSTVVERLGIEPDLLVHRLDRGTSGCLLIAKDTEVRSLLQDQFKQRTVEKSYLAVVLGIPSPEEAVIDAPVGRSPTDARVMSVFRSTTQRSARTSYRVMAKGPSASLLLCQPETGRTHQIRVHLKSIRHPILGDRTYGTSASKELSDHVQIGRLCLHAWRIRFRPPYSSEERDVESPVPEEFKAYQRELNILPPL